MNVLERVLYVEDDPDIQTVAKLALEVVGGLTVKVCSSGEQALAEAEAFAPDMILLDVMMPGMDGPSTLAALRQRPALANVPVAFMTAKVQPHEVEQLIALGAESVIAKPFDPMTLAPQVRSLWEQACGEK
ncbi:MULTISPECIES: response regulator [Halomonadaceae]|uniref:Response regulator n=2 Tax=Halomonadaceae TaxID=28256 RepID=A0A8H9I3X2_9GAMM|nr:MULTISPECIES: response regulator [Halomonas]GGW27473.1 response regulator [Halomonas hamiltonii]GGW64011.1 response regulator [Halomonas johnsoniae]